MNKLMITKRILKPAEARIFLTAVLLAVLMFESSGCGPGMTVFLHPEADISFYTKVGVVPFKSITGDRFAGEKFSIEFTTALLASQMFDVIDYGIFAKSLEQTVGVRSPADGLTVEDLIKVKEKTKVQAVFEGTVKQYEMTSTGSGTFPIISVEARLVDTETGNVIWMATSTRRGGPKMPIIGFGEIHTLGELAQKICKNLVAKIE